MRQGVAFGDRASVAKNAALARTTAAAPRRRRRHCCVVAAASSTDKANTTAVPLRFAVIGAGLAGLATAYHLVASAPPGQPVRVTLVDAAGIGAGGSGAAAGLLHPLSPKGRSLWRAREAMAEALELLRAAEEAAAAAVSAGGGDAGAGEPIAWRTGMLRPSASLKQAAAYRRACAECADGGGGSSGGTSGSGGIELYGRCVGPEEALMLVPGVPLPAVDEALAAAAVAADVTTTSSQTEQQHQQQQHSKQQRKRKNGGGGGPPSDPREAGACAALHVPSGVTLHPARYMRALWAACRARAAARGDGSAAVFEVRRLRSVAELHGGPDGPHAAGVIVAAGAAIGSLAEFEGGKLPLELCQGYTLDLGAGPADPTSSSSSSSSGGGGGDPPPPPCAYPSDAPSLLGTPYIASQGGALLVVGATKSHDWTAARALAECGRVVDAAAYRAAAARIAAAIAASADTDDDGSDNNGDDDVTSALRELLAGGARAWPHLVNADGWHLAGVRTGVRALPPRTSAGSIPLMGRWPPPPPSDSGPSDSSGSTAATATATPAAAAAAAPPLWVLVGLGARGLVYHAWLGRCAASAALAGDESLLPPETLAWRETVV